MEKICQSLLKISEPIKYALAHKLPIVALESTIISHGMPYPDNKHCALSIQKTVRQQGAFPATIAIFEGKIHVGLEEQQIQLLAKTGKQVKKVSRRDLPYIIANKKIGATTVSATMIGAHAAGIDMFVTGGIGGVHRGFQKTLDISADLQELGNTPVTVVSAGVKSILDIPKTLQYLQTKGVPVLTFKSNYFPAFFSTSSGLLTPFQVNSERQASEFIWAHKQLGLRNGMLIAVPNDKPAQSAEIEKAITTAIKQAEQNEISGAQMTPFLLKRVNELTQGQSLKSNISLVHNNARVGSAIAVQLSKLYQQKTKKSMNIILDRFGYAVKGSSGQKPEGKRKGGDRKILAIGGAAIDYQLKASDPKKKFELRKSCAGKSRKTMGGVARNIAECCSKFEGFDINLISAFGSDQDTDLLLQSCSKLGIDVFPIKNEGHSCKYYAIMDEYNNQLIGISEMQINESLTFENVKENYLSKQKLNKGDIVIIDCNFSEASLKQLVRYCSQKGCFVVFEAKGQKTRKIISSDAYKYVNLIKMNAQEKKQIIKALQDKFKPFSTPINQWLSQNTGKQLKQQSQYTDIKCIITNQQKDIELIRANQKYQFMPVSQSDCVAKTTGAGDAFTGAFASMLILGKPSQEALKYAKVTSRINIQTDIKQSTISPEISIEKIEQLIKKLQL